MKVLLRAADQEGHALEELKGWGLLHLRVKHPPTDLPCQCGVLSRRRRCWRNIAITLIDFIFGEQTRFSRTTYGRQANRNHTLKRCASAMMCRQFLSKTRPERHTVYDEIILSRSLPDLRKIINWELLLPIGESQLP